MPITHSTTPDGSFSDAGRAAWTAEHSLPVASEITFTPSGSGAVAETLESRNRWVLYVTDFMSVADRASLRAGTAVDATTAINNAITRANVLYALGQAAASTNHPVAWFPAPIIKFPPGALKVTSQIVSAVPRIKLQGENTLISTISNGVLASDYLFKFTAAYDLEVEGIEFGSTETGCVEVAAANISTARVTFRQCKFLGNDSAGDTALKYDNRSSILNIENCLFMENTYAIEHVIGDHVHVTGCWFAIDNVASKARTADSGYIKTGSDTSEPVFIVDKCLFSGGPATGNTRVAFFVVTAACDLRILNTRIAFETGSATIVNWKKALVTSTGSAMRPGVTIDNCTLSTRGEDQTYGDGSSATPVIRLYTMPNRIHFTNNNCRGTHLGLLFADVSTSNATLYALVQSYAELTARSQNTGIVSYKFEGNNGVRQYVITTSSNVEQAKWNALFNSFNYHFQITDANPDTAGTSLRVNTFFTGDQLDYNVFEVALAMAHPNSGNKQSRRWVVRVVKDATATTWKFLTQDDDDAAALNGFTVALTPQFADFATATPAATIATTEDLADYYLTFLIAPSASSASIQPLYVKPLRNFLVSGTSGGLTQYRFAT